MVGGSFIALTAMVGAGLSGFAIGSTASHSIQRRRRSQTAIGDGDISMGHWLLRNGVPLFMPVSRWMMGVAPIERFVLRVVDALRLRGFATSDQAVASLGVLMGAVLLLVPSLVSGTVVCGIAMAGAAFIACAGYVSAIQEKHRMVMTEAVPEALRSMSVCFRSGLSLLQTLRQVSMELRNPMGRLFDTATRRMETGCSIQESLQVFKEQDCSNEMAFIAVSLDVQHQCGGSIGPVLDSVRTSVEDQIELRRSLRVQTAQAKLSARIVTLMPFVLIALFSLLSGNFLQPFFSSLGGLSLLALALTMQGAGVLMVRNMLNVETK